MKSQSTEFVISLVVFQCIWSKETKRGPTKKTWYSISINCLPYWKHYCLTESPNFTHFQSFCLINTVSMTSVCKFNVTLMIWYIGLDVRLLVCSFATLYLEKSNFNQDVFLFSSGWIMIEISGNVMGIIYFVCE